MVEKFVFKAAKKPEEPLKVSENEIKSLSSEQIPGKIKELLERVGAKTIFKNEKVEYNDDVVEIETNIELKKTTERDIQGEGSIFVDVNESKMVGKLSEVMGVYAEKIRELMTKKVLDDKEDYDIFDLKFDIRVTKKDGTPGNFAYINVVAKGNPLE